MKKGQKKKELSNSEKMQLRKSWKQHASIKSLHLVNQNTLYFLPDLKKKNLLQFIKNCLHSDDFGH